MNNTSKQYDSVVTKCLEVFTSKMKDYGSAWRILRTRSLTDQIYIKANRIRSIDEMDERRVDEGIYGEFIGIINYSLMALIQLELATSKDLSLSEKEALGLYNNYIQKSKSLMENKNHDYGEAWRNMRISSLTDIILMKLMRVKQIEDNEGQTFVSEGLDANYYDIINYAVFALIKLDEEQ